MDLEQNKIILHNMTLRGIEVVPGVLDFDQRGLIYANKGDVVITRRAIDNDYLSYLENLGWNLKKCIFLNPKNIKNYTFKSVFYDKRIIKKTKMLNGYYIDTYNMTSEESKFAKKIKKPIYINSVLAEKYGTKSGFRMLAKKLGLRTVDGFEKIISVRQLEKAIKNLFNRGKAEIAVKIDEAVSGAGITKINSKNYKKLFPSVRQKILKNSLFKIKQAQKNSGAVVEEWLQNTIASPSIQVQVFLDKNWKIVSSHDQILEGEEKWYIGCKYPQKSLRKKRLTSLVKNVRKFTNFLIANGFIGFFGLDFIVTNEQKIYWTEANIRKPATFYPRIIAEKLNNGTLNRVFYIATDYTIPKFKGAKFLQLKKEFSQLLYPMKGKKEGAILYNVGALKDAGRFDIVCIGQTERSASRIYSNVRAKVNKLKS